MTERRGSARIVRPTIKPALRAEIEKLAITEHRTFTGQLEKLIFEALAARDSGWNRRSRHPALIGPDGP